MPRKPKPSAEQTFAIEKLANTGPRGFFTQGLKAAEEFCKKRDSESFARVSTVLIAIARAEIDRFKGINGGKGRVTADNKPTTDTVGDQETKPPADHVAEVAQSIGFTDAARRLRSG